jgi:hypothetical protein
MLGSLLKSVFAARPPEPEAAPTPAVSKEELSRRFDAALADWRAGRHAAAAEACKALLQVAPNHGHARSLLVAIDLPGEDYFRVLERVQGHLKPRTYVEIGVWEGESIRLAGPGTRVIGVDPEPRIKFELGSNVRIFAKKSDDFFAQHDVRAELGGLPIDLAFIDGMHRFEFALRDFANIEALCTPDSTILIHDAYPFDEHTAARERATGFWSGDIWRLVLLLRKHRPDLAIHTIAACPTGLTVVRNLDPESRYLRDHLEELIREYLAVDFSVLEGRKPELLARFPNEWMQIRALLGEPAWEAAR